MKTLALGLIAIWAGPTGLPPELIVLEKRVSAVAPRVLAATVGLSLGGVKGSGVLVDEQGLIVTAGHLFRRAGQRARVYLSDGRSAWGRTLGRNAEDDYGLVRIEGAGGPWPFAEMGSAEQLRPGDECLATGHPGGYQRGRPPVLRLGRITSLGGQYIGSDCIINLGDSGGPLFDLDGRVIAIHSEFRPWVTANYHAAIDKVRRNWKRLLAGEVWSQRTTRSGPYLRRRSGRTAAFAPLLAGVRSSIVRLRENGRTLAFGTIVSRDGEILAKASTLPAQPRCLLPGASGDRPARVLALDPPTDLALLQVAAGDLQAVSFAGEPTLTPGRWAVSAGPTTRPLGVGIISVAPRPIPPAEGFLGVELEQGPGFVRVVAVDRDSAAERAGLRREDRITAIEGTAVASVRALQRAIHSHQSGSLIAIEVVRGAQELRLQARLGERAEPLPRGFPRRSLRLSLRRSGFPLALQHDTPLRPSEMGTPLLDSAGAVVGINIARAGRTQSYALPAPLVRAALARLRAR